MQEEGRAKKKSGSRDPLFLQQSPAAIQAVAGEDQAALAFVASAMTASATFFGTGS